MGGIESQRSVVQSEIETANRTPIAINPENFFAKLADCQQAFRSSGAIFCPEYSIHR
jgi:hypothetical protein